MLERNKKTTKYDKSTIICDVGIVPCENDTLKYKKKIKLQPNVRKVRSDMMLILPNVTIEPSFVRKEKLNHQM